MRRSRVRRNRDADRHPHLLLRPAARLQPEREAVEDPGRVSASRSRSARSRAERPRARAGAADHAGHGRERDPHVAQPARARAARHGRPHGAARHGRGLRHVEDAEAEVRLPSGLGRLARARPERHDPARPQPPQRVHLEHRQRDPRAGRHVRHDDHTRARRHRPPPRPDPSDHRRQRSPGPRQLHHPLRRTRRDRHQLPPVHVGGLPADVPRPELRRDRGGVRAEHPRLLRATVRQHRTLRRPVDGGPGSDPQSRLSTLRLRRPRRRLGLAARGVATHYRRARLPLRDVRLDRLRLPRRAHSLRLARPQLLLRYRRPRRLPEGRLLALPEPVDGPSGPAPLSALELDGRRYDRRLGLHERRRGRAVPERPVARNEASRGRCAAPDVARALDPGHAARRRPQGGTRHRDRRGEDGRRARRDRAQPRSHHDRRGRQGPLLHLDHGLRLGRRSRTDRRRRDPFSASPEARRSRASTTATRSATHPSRPTA